MALTATTPYVCISSWTCAHGTYRDGEIVLGANLDAEEEPRVVELGSTPAQVQAAQIAAGLTVTAGTYELKR